MTSAPDLYGPRFWSKVQQSADCWLWAASTDRDGYGRFWMDGRLRCAHRVAYEWAHGPIASGLELDHRCRQPACVRPDHLEPVTPRVNTLRSSNTAAQNAIKTHCIHGHVFTPENTYLRNTPPGRPPWRGCRTCRVARDRARLRRSA